MNPDILVAIIAAAPGFLVALRANHNAKGAKRNSASAKYQVENDHTTNFREDMDAKFKDVVERIKGVGGSIGGLRDDHRELSKRVHDLELIEMTQPKRRKE